MIKILFFIENLKAGGAEKVMIDLVNHMDQSQSKFDITVHAVWADAVEQDARQGRGEKATEVQAIEKGGFVSRVFAKKLRVV